MNEEESFSFSSSSNGGGDNNFDDCATLHQPHPTDTLEIGYEDDDGDGNEDDDVPGVVYYFRTLPMPRCDVMLYEVTKPHVDQPFTAVIFNFSQRGHTPFFSSLFICSQWGTTQTDIDFLHKAWNLLEMEGPFDIHEIMHRGVSECFPSPTNGYTPSAEPIVYRRTMEETRAIISQRYSGVYCSNTGCRDLKNELVDR